MKSNRSNTNNLNWYSSLKELYPNNRIPKTIENLENVKIIKISDLLNIFPLRAQKAPRFDAIKNSEIDQLFKGQGEVFNIKKQRSFSGKGKKNIPLFNVTIIVKDQTDFISLKWFNAYPNIVKKLEQASHLIFMGKVTEFSGAKQIINPSLLESKEELETNEILIEYPTVSKISGNLILGVIKKIPNYVWDIIPENLPINILEENHLLGRSTTYKSLHAKGGEFLKLKDKAIGRMIYEEFFIDQVKIIARRQSIKEQVTEVIKNDDNFIKKAKSQFSYELTPDQNQVLNDINRDFSSGVPMMRMLQGDVGSGKTTVAQISALMVAHQGFQVAIMAPTETLANQHYKTMADFFKHFGLKTELLVGSLKAKEKKASQLRIQKGEVSIIIGTHSLFQDAVEFKALKYMIIDEQHKFGVEQRIKLQGKGDGVHSLIMSATPIPRTLQLVNYGDLDISTIFTMPKGRKGTKTRIVGKENFQNFLSFVKTRLTLKEQVYFVVPAIEESELDLNNINEMMIELTKYFPDQKIDAIHGQLKSEIKNQIARDFNDGKINILLATSVIEVGINVLNATVMAIYNPERFGLSSLHQLRGRVGRSDKAGFCFLVINQDVSQTGLERLKVLEQTTDGFKIAEADLEFRGEGDLFGAQQSGSTNNKRFANIFKHSEILNKASKDIFDMLEKNDGRLVQLINQIEHDEKIRVTI